MKYYVTPTTELPKRPRPPHYALWDEQGNWLGTFPTEKMALAQASQRRMIDKRLRA